MHELKVLRRAVPAPEKRDLGVDNNDGYHTFHPSCWDYFLVPGPSDKGLFSCFPNGMKRAHTMKIIMEQRHAK